MNRNLDGASKVAIPAPTVMPVDRDAWYKELPLSAFVNAHYQFRDISYCGDCSRILIIGPGQGLVPALLKWRGFQVTTLDIDAVFEPDYVGSVHDMHFFDDTQFDVVIASHVLEHLAVPYLDVALREMARVSKSALIYLPVAGRHAHLRMKADVKGFDISAILDVFNVLHRPDGITPRYCQGQHFWEVGMRGFRRSDLIRRFEANFNVLQVYRNRDWVPSCNFVLRTREQ